YFLASFKNLKNSILLNGRAFVFCYNKFTLSLAYFTVCTGTQNSLSVTGSSEVQYKLMKEMYTGCKIVIGNLEITQMEHNRDFSFLQIRPLLNKAHVWLQLG
uniref:Uncharacterized protein n=1 Tax=Sinocyclocheilus grahami TaxID=75366 RepID=A0A672TCE3_SINGR